MCEQPSVRCEEREPTSGFTFSSRALNPATTSLMVSLRVLTPDATARHRAVKASLGVVRCEQTYSCHCAPCVAEKAFLMRNGTRDRKQPWTIRKAA